MRSKVNKRFIAIAVVAFLGVAGLVSYTKGNSSERFEEDANYCKDFGIVETGGFCLNEDQIFVGYNNLWGPAFAKAVETIVGGGSLVDFGAGLGHYGRYFLRKKEKIFARKFSQDEDNVFFNRKEVREILHTAPTISHYEGYDGALNVEKVTSGFLKHLDLAEKQDLGKKFDWVMSLEVGEHIPNRFEQIFMDNLVRHACTGIILSWAVEGQGGHFHVNNHNNTYVKDRMREHGFDSCTKQEEYLRNEADLGHFKNTVMVFIAQSPAYGKGCVETYTLQC